jgi:hypothetical protein
VKDSTGMIIIHIVPDSVAVAKDDEVYEKAVRAVDIDTVEPAGSNQFVPQAKARITFVGPRRMAYVTESVSEVVEQVNRQTDQGLAYLKRIAEALEEGVVNHSLFGDD